MDRFLTAGYIFIRQKNKIAHRNCMIAAFVTSIVFLICYLTYHTWLGAVLHHEQHKEERSGPKPTFYPL